MSPGLVDWPKSPLNFFTNLGRAIYTHVEVTVGEEECPRQVGGKEMDFFLRSGENLVPVEVKSGNTKAKSMRTLIDGEHYKDIKWGIKLVKGNVGFSNGVLTIPHWCAFFLRRLVKDRAK